MASGLLALLDDIASLLDDIALLTRVAARKTAGVIGDDLALNAQQVTGMRADRELPVIWAVARGAFLNKVILVPAALLISAFAPWAIRPLLMIGGLFLCYEGFHKVWEKFAHRRDGTGDEEARAARLAATADPAVDMVAWEKTRVKGAIRTDFILSAEIVVIALGTMNDASIRDQILALTAVGVGVTVLVYGLVGLIVKVDDFGLRLQRDAAPTEPRHRIGTALLRGMPWLMKTLSVVGTAAMFLVGGSILTHGIPPLEHLVHDLPGPVKALVDAVVGIVAGAIVVGVVHAIGALRGKKPAAAAGH